MNRLRLVLCLPPAAVILAVAAPSGAAENMRVYLPLVRAPDIGLRGLWYGALTQAGKVFDFRLALTQAGTEVQGTATIRANTKYATMRLTGAVYGKTVVLDELAITETNGTPPDASRWCIKTLTLTPEGTGDQALLVGTWKQDGCNSGRVYLQRTEQAASTVSGTWTGAITQGSTMFSYEISLNQQQMVLEGVATTRRDSAFGTMRVSGFVVGRHVLLQETEVLTSGGSGGWCLKTVEAALSPGMPRTLEGTWSALACLPGAISVQQ